MLMKITGHGFGSTCPLALGIANILSFAFKGKIQIGVQVKNARALPCTSIMPRP